MQHRLGIRLDEKRLKQVKIRAKNFRLDVSEYVRRLIDNDLQQQLQLPSALNILEVSSYGNDKLSESNKLWILSSIETLLLVRSLIPKEKEDLIAKAGDKAKQFLESVEQS